MEMQISDIAGDVKRCVDSRLSYEQGKSQKDYSGFWFDKVDKECRTFFPDRVLPEFLDELGELKRFLNGETDADYILRYWKPYESMK